MSDLKNTKDVRSQIGRGVGGRLKELKKPCPGRIAETPRAGTGDFAWKRDLIKNLQLCSKVFIEPS